MYHIPKYKTQNYNSRDKNIEENLCDLALGKITDPQKKKKRN